jgi:phosphinothricin acetyltransferase
MPIRDAQRTDLPAIVQIYNASIPGRMATADTAPVTVASREAWFAEFEPARRPLWVWTAGPEDHVAGWVSLRSFYGRPAYHATVEIGVYVDPAARRRGVARGLLAHAVAEAPRLRIRTLLGFVFGHNTPSLALLGQAGFAAWGRLPAVAELDGVERDLVIAGRRVAG